MKEKILNIIEEMNNELIEHRNSELDRWKNNFCTLKDAMYCMDIIEGKAVILEQLKEEIENITEE